MESKLKFFSKVIFAQCLGFFVSSLLITQVFMGPRPVLRPDLKERVKVLPLSAKKYAVVVYTSIESGVKKIVKSQKKEETTQAHVPPPWVFEPAPSHWLPTSPPTPTLQPTRSVESTPIFRFPTFFPRQPTNAPQQPTNTQPTATSYPTAKPSDSPPPTSEGNNNLEEQVMQLINQNRSNSGLFTVQMNENLRAAARRHSNDLQKNGCIGHTGSDGSLPPQRIRDSGYSGSLVGETIGCLYKSANAIVQGWMGSPGHRAIIMDSRARLIGIGWVGNYQTAVVGY